MSKKNNQSLWRSTADVWPFLMGMFGCGLAAFFLNIAGRAYEQPNTLTDGAAVAVLAAGACVIACVIGLLHLGFHLKAKITWGSVAMVMAILSVVTFFAGGRALTPGLVFCLILLLLTVPGVFWGLQADRYRAQFPDKPKFLGDWD